MNDQIRFQAQAIPAGNTMDMSVDAGLRSFMLGVYNKMGLGLVLHPRFPQFATCCLW